MELRNRVVELREVDTAALQDNAGNWRTHPQAQRDALAGLLAEVGIAGALTVYHSERQGGLTLIDGHLRRADYPDVTWPALVLDVNDAEADLLLAALDPLAALAEVAGDKLKALLEGLPGQDDGLGAMLDGLAQEADEALAAMREPAEDPGPQVDKAAELQEKWQVKVGDLWVIPSLTVNGEHCLMCGDSTTLGNVERLMDGQRALLMATDPPYGDAWVQKARDMHARGYGHSRAGNRAAIEADDLNESELEKFVSSWLSIAVDVALTPPASVYVWHGAKRTLFELSLKAAGFHVHQPVIWVKPSFVIGRLNYHPRCEWALHGWVKGNGRGVFYGDRNQSDVWEVKRESGWHHPTQKPVELYARPMQNHLRKGEMSFDPFAGSGTALVAAEQTHTVCRAMELKEEYCAVTLERLEGMGLEPRLVSEL